MEIKTIFFSLKLPHLYTYFFLQTLNFFSQWLLIDIASQKFRYCFFLWKFFFEKEFLMLIVCWRSINPLTIFRHLIFTEFLFYVSIKLFNFLNVTCIFLWKRRFGTTCRNFRKNFCASICIFSLENYPYLLCALFHAIILTHNRIFDHKGIDALLSRFKSFCEHIDKWMKENILLDGSLSSCFIYQDIRQEIWDYILKLCVTHSLRNR